MFETNRTPPPCGMFCGPRGHSRVMDPEVSGPRGAQSPTTVTSEQGTGGEGSDGCEEAAFSKPTYAK